MCIGPVVGSVGVEMVVMNGVTMDTEVDMEGGTGALEVEARVVIELATQGLAPRVVMCMD
jgi:hypothetical protein